MLALCIVLAIYPADILILTGQAAVQHSFSASGLIAPLYLMSVLAYLRIACAKHPLLLTALFCYMAIFAVAPWLPGSWYLDYATHQPFVQLNHYIYTLGIGAWVMKVSSYALIACAAAIVVYRVSASRSPHSYVLTLAIFPILAGVFDLIASLVGFSPHYGISTVQIATTVGSFALSFALLRRQMLERVPMSRDVLISHMREGLCVISEHGEIVDCNDAMAAIVCRSPDALVGRLANHVLPEPVLAQLDVQRLKGEVVVDVEVRWEATSGAANGDRYANGLRIASVSVSRLDDGPATLLSITDVTQRSQQLESVEAAAGELREANEYLAALSNTDELTGLGNRRLMRDALTERLREDDSGSTGLIMVDIDHFKAINDTHGHLAGDAVLVRLAKVMRETCRDKDLIVRWGGEEFVALLGNSDERRLQLAAERLRMHIRRLVIELDNGVALQVTASIGATLVRPGQSAESALRQVDRLLYEAKSEGRDRVKASLLPEG